MGCPGQLLQQTKVALPSARGRAGQQLPGPGAGNWERACGPRLLPAAGGQIQPLAQLSTAPACSAPKNAPQSSFGKPTLAVERGNQVE